MPRGSICDSLDARVIYDSGLSKFAKVIDIIDNGRWAWPGTNTNELMDLRALTNDMDLPRISTSDKIVWKSPYGNEFSVRAAWEVMRSHHDEVNWHSIVWFKSHVPRYSFILWLAIRQRLLTQDRLILHGVGQPSRCFLCKADCESHRHLFFQCSYTARLWFELLRKLGVSCSASSWDDIVTWCAHEFRGSSLLHLLGRLGITTLVYFIWKERNARCFEDSSMEVLQLWKVIENTIRLRVISCKPFPRTDSNRHLVSVWCFPPSVLMD